MKKLMAIVLTLVLMVSVLGCGKKAADTTAAPETATTQEVATADAVVATPDAAAK